MAQMEMVRQLSARDDHLGNRDIGQIIERAVATRRRTIRVIREKARTADEIHKGCAASNRDANIIGAFGGVFGMCAGGITIASDGLAAPIVIGSLTCVGALCSVGGGAWSVKNEYDRGQHNSVLQEELLQQLAEDEDALRDMDEIIHRIERGDFGEPYMVFRELHMFFAGLGSIGMTFGSAAAFDSLRVAIPPILYFLSGGSSKILLGMVQILPLIAGKGALEGMEEIAEQSASSAVKSMCSGFSKDFVRQEALKAAQKTYKEIIEDTLEKAATEAAKQAAEEGGNLVAQHAARQAAKEAAAKAAKETGTKAAKGAASRAAQEGMKTAAKVTGVVTAGFGALTSLWEGKNAYQNHYKSQGESQLGRELRLLANRMETA